MNKEKRFLKIIGNRPVNGVIKTSGSKNAALPLIAASLLIKGEISVNTLQLLKNIGSRTNSDIYVGVVGPVRVGKSTFIRKFIPW